MATGIQGGTMAQQISAFCKSINVNKSNNDIACYDAKNNLKAVFLGDSIIQHPDYGLYLHRDWGEGETGIILNIDGCFHRRNENKDHEFLNSENKVVAVVHDDSFVCVIGYSPVKNIKHLEPAKHSPKIVTEHFENMKRKNWIKEIWDSISIKPGAFGVNIDIKKLFFEDD